MKNTNVIKPIIVGVFLIASLPLYIVILDSLVEYTPSTTIGFLFILVIVLLSAFSLPLAIYSCYSWFLSVINSDFQSKVIHLQDSSVLDSAQVSDLEEQRLILLADRQKKLKIYTESWWVFFVFPPFIVFSLFGLQNKNL